MNLKADILKKFLDKLKDNKIIPLELIEFIKTSFENDKIINVRQLREKLEVILNNEFKNKKN
ncbi:MAG: hypothetical protein ACTSQP_23910 [Promethearchaeota archaeon]